MDELIAKMATRLAERSIPPMVLIDATNTCNLQCVHCPQPAIQRALGFKPLHMSLTHLKKIVDEIRASGLDTLLRITGDGEPTINPQLLEMVEYTKTAPNIALNLTTNGLNVDADYCSRLLEANIDLVDFSIDALTKPVFDQVRRGGKFDKLIRNIMHFIFARNSLRKKTKIMVSFVEQKENRHEVEGFVNFWEPLVDQVLVRRLHSALGEVKVSESIENNDAKLKNRFPCPHLWKRLTIDFNGSVKYCAHDWVNNQGIILGNIEYDSLSDIWAGAKLKNLRQNHLNNKFPEDSVCGHCTDWASTDWRLGYERLVDKLVYTYPNLAAELDIEE